MKPARRPVPSAASRQLYDVINGRGLVLMLGVTRRKAHRTITVQQSEQEVHPQWRGAMRVEVARRGAGVIECDTRVGRANSRLIVCCSVWRFFPSGLTVDELFTRLRPQLLASIADAAARDPGRLPAPRAVSVQADVGAVDPSFSLMIDDPVACMADLDASMHRLQLILERVITGLRCGGGL